MTGKVNRSLASYALKIKDDEKYECCAIAGGVKASHATPTQLSRGC